MKNYRSLVLAGTFDHLHLGHQQFIKKASQNSQKMYLGLTTGWANSGKVLGKNIQSFSSRFKSLKNFLSLNSLDKKVQIFGLTDPYGPSLKNRFEAIAVTPDTFNGAHQVNLRRLSLGLKPLLIKTFDLVNAQDKQKISSTRIRLGQINRQGRVYSQVLGTKNLSLPQEKRHHFKKPLGKLLLGSQHNLSWAGVKALQNINKLKPSLVISVGDITTQTLLLNKAPVNLAVFDNRCQRQPLKVNLHQELKNKALNYVRAPNKPGTISFKAVKQLQLLLPSLVLSEKTGVLEIKGEEDLLVLPLVLLSPLKTLIFYGQPHKGLVQIKVTESLKEKTASLLSQFQPEL